MLLAQRCQRPLKHLFHKLHRFEQGQPFNVIACNGGFAVMQHIVKLGLRAAAGQYIATAKQQKARVCYSAFTDGFQPLQESLVWQIQQAR